MSARILAGGEGVSAALHILRGGGVVGVPTETVYGLGADAFQPMAVARVFEAKGRPLIDPLIVHLPEEGWVDRVVSYSSHGQKELANRLARAFWPGPLTLLLPRRKALPELVTAGSNQVAVRVTSHPLFQELLLRLGSPMAAPSANRFGSISPTSAQDVQIELGNKISLVLDGGPCRHGLESTIVAVEEDHLAILRPGPITEDQLIEIGHVLAQRPGVHNPGNRPGHYAPKKELQIIKTDIKSVLSGSKKQGLLAFTPPSAEVADCYAKVEILSRDGSLREAAANFYGALRRLDLSDVDIIVAQSLPCEGIGTAIMDRLRRAEHGSKHGTGGGPATSRE